MSKEFIQEKRSNESLSKAVRQYKQLSYLTISKIADDFDLQYFKDYKLFLQKIFKKKPKYIFFSGTSFFKDNIEKEKWIVKQTNILPHTVYLYFFNFNKFKTFFKKNGYKLVFQQKNKFAKVNYKNFEEDLSEKNEFSNPANLMEKAKIFFKRNGLLLNWKELEKLNQNQKVNTLAMICPVTNEEKQKILETVTLSEKVAVLEDIINFYLYEVNFNNQTLQ